MNRLDHSDPRIVAVLLALICAACAPAVLDRAATIPYIEAGYEPPTTATHAIALSDVFTNVARMGVTIIYLDEADPAFGRADRAARRIGLHPTLGLDARLEVLAHEAAHLLQPPGL